MQHSNLTIYPTRYQYIEDYKHDNNSMQHRNLTIYPMREKYIGDYKHDDVLKATQEPHDIPDE